MKKTFKLHEPGKADERVAEAIKHEVRKYVKRERRKALPAGVDFWDFDCKVGADQAEPEMKHLAEVASAIEAIARSDGPVTVYVEILAKPGHRLKKAVATDAAVSQQSGEESKPV
jgi:Family of unknown function (DUF6172)